MFWPCMPVGERTDRRVAWNHFYLILAARRFCRWLRLASLQSLLLPPREPFLAVLKTCEIAPARRAPIRRGPQPHLDDRPRGRMVILLAPGGQILAIATRAAGIFPVAAGPSAGFPSGMAFPAPQRIYPKNRFKVLDEMTAVRYLYITQAAIGAGQLHPGYNSIDYTEFNA